MRIEQRLGHHNGQPFCHKLQFGEPTTLNLGRVDQKCYDFSESGKHRDVSAIVAYGALRFLDGWAQIQGLRDRAKVGTRGEGWLEEPVYSSKLWEEAVLDSKLVPRTKTVLVLLGPVFGTKLPKDALDDDAPDHRESAFWEFVNTCKEIIIEHGNVGQRTAA